MFLITDDHRLHTAKANTRGRHTLKSNRAGTMVRSIFDITERNEESEFTGGNKSLISNIFNRADSKNRQSNRCASQTFRFSNLSNNILSQQNVETEILEAGGGAATLETERHSIHDHHQE